MDKIVKTFKYKEMPIVIYYNDDYFLGYVSVSKESKLFGVNYNDLDICYNAFCPKEITYSAGYSFYPISSIGLWWFGFHTDKEIVDIKKVTEYCILLADQLERINNGEKLFIPDIEEYNKLSILEKCEILRQEVEINEKRKCIMMDCLTFLDQVKGVVVDGKKYVKIDYTLTNGQQCGLYMVDKETGIVYGIKGYGKVNKMKMIKKL